MNAKVEVIITQPSLALGQLVGVHNSREFDENHVMLILHMNAHKLNINFGFRHL